MHVTSSRPLGPIAGLPPVVSRTTPQERFVEKALQFLGQPLAWGGGHGAPMTRPGAVDASGLVQQAARMAGFNLDGRAQDQQKKGVAVPMADLKPGDLVFHGTPATHVGIYAGDGYVIAASSSRRQVALTNLSYFDNARRVFDNAGRPLTTRPAPRPKPPAPKPAPAPDPAGGALTYTVRYGDTLWKIAQAQLGSGARWREIYAANTDVLGEPNHVIPGQVLRLPAAEPLGGGAGVSNPYFNDY